MTAFTIKDLQDAAREVIGDPDIELTLDMTANDVPGWDSLNHTLICVELGLRLGRTVEPQEMAQLPDFASMVRRLS